MKIYYIHDIDVAARHWFATKTEALKAFRKSGASDNMIDLGYVEIGQKKSDLIDFLNCCAGNSDCLGDEPDFDDCVMEKDQKGHHYVTLLSKNEPVLA